MEEYLLMHVLNKCALLSDKCFGQMHSRAFEQMLIYISDRCMCLTTAHFVRQMQRLHNMPINVTCSNGYTNQMGGIYRNDRLVGHHSIPLSINIGCIK